MVLVWVILYLSRERQLFEKNTLVYIRRKKKQKFIFWGGNFSEIFFIDFFCIDFWLSFFEILLRLRMQLDIFLYDFWNFLVLFIEAGKNGSFFLYTCRVFFFLSSKLYTQNRKEKFQLSSSNCPNGRKHFHRSKRCTGKSPLHGVPEKQNKNQSGAKINPRAQCCTKIRAKRAKVPKNIAL